MSSKLFRIKYRVDKKKSIYLIFLLSLIFYTSKIGAQTVTVDNINYRIDTTSQTATCTGLASASETINDMTIPDYVIYDSKNYPVTAISNSAFQNKSNIKGKITFGANLESIGNNTFEKCTGITSLDFSEAKKLTEIIQSVFRGCTSLETIIFGENSPITKLGDSMYSIMQSGPFADCSALRSVDLQNCNNLEFIGWAAFQYCVNLTNLSQFPESLKTIKGIAFEDCESLHGELIIPDNVEEIGFGAFKDCSGIESVVIGRSVQEIGTPIGGYGTGGAFSNCTSLQKITILALTPPKMVGTSNFDNSTLANALLLVPEQSLAQYKNTGEWSNFSKISEIKEPTEGMDFEYEGIWYTVISTSEMTVQTRQDGYRYGHQNLSGTLSIPSTVDYYGFTFKVVAIGDYSFYECKNLSGELKLPDSLTTIGNSAFDGSSGFTGSLAIPNSVTSIGYRAFENCIGFNGTLTLGNSITTIGNRAFRSCSGFTGSLTIPDSVTEIGEEVFYDCSGFNGTLTLGNSIATIGNRAFCGCSGFTGSLTIPNSVTTIGNYAFTGCFSFNGSLIIPESVITIGDGAFSGCSGFNGSLIIPESVITIGVSAFWGCSGFTGSLTLPNSVTTIGDSAFMFCSGFTGSLTIGNSVTTIGAYAFDECRGFTGSLTIPDLVTGIGVYAFSGCTGFTGTLTIGNSVTTIGAFAFQGTDMEKIISTNSVPPNCENGVFDSYNVPLYVPSASINSYKNAEVWSNFSKIYGIGEEPVEGMNFQYDGIWYTVISTSEMTVKTRDNGYQYGHQNLSGSLIIPSTVEYYGYTFRVVAIGNYSFYQCKNLSGELKLPDSLTTIGTYAFYDCTGFNGTLTLGNSITSIGEAAFLFCKGFTGSLTIPDSVTIIGKYAFWFCSGFNGSLTIPDSVITLGAGAFGGCSGFTGSLTIPDSVTEIGNDAFNGCSGFTGSLTIPNSVTNIGNYAFAACSGFTGSLTIPNSVTTIGNNAFVACSGFTGSLTLGNSVTTIGDRAFQEIEFENIISTNSVPPSCGEEVFSSYNIPLYVPSESFNSYKSANEWSKFSKIYGIGGEPIEGLNFEYNGIWYTIISASEMTVKTRDYGYQYGHQNLSGTLTIPSTVEYFESTLKVVAIGEYSFYECKNLRGELKLPESLTSIGEFAFNGCTGFTGSLTLPNSITEIGESAFNGCTGFSGSLTLPNSVTTIGNRAFLICTGFTGSLTLPESVITIGDGAFEGCLGFTGSLTIPNSVITIGDGAFWTCTGFNGTLTIGNSVTSIGNRAFLWCEGFTGTLTIPDSVITIGDFAFSSCFGLTGALTIGSSVTSIGDDAFAGVPFEKIISTNSIPPTCGERVFGSYNIPLFVPSDSVNSYKNAGVWSDFYQIYGIGEEPEEGMNFQYNGIWYTVISTSEMTVQTREDGYQYGHQNLSGSLIIPSTVEYYGYTFRVVTIGEYSFYDCKNLNGELTLPDGLTSIGGNAFYNCSGFTGSLTIPNSVTTIGNKAFSGCTGFTGELTIPNSVTSIGFDGFYGCTGFTGSLIIPDSVTIIYSGTFSGCTGFTGSLIIPDSVTIIYSGTFSGCTGFTGSLTIPDSVITIEDFAFADCTGFTGSLTIPDSVITIGNYAFADCSGFTGSLTIPDSVATIGDYAFYGCSGFNGSLTIPDSVTIIGESTFYSCSGLTGSLTIPDSVTKISMGAFGNCSGFTGSLTIPNSVTEIGSSTFDGCSGFTGSLTIPNSVTTIGNYAFANCSGFTGSLTIPNSVTKIGDSAFMSCTGFTGSLTIGNSVTEIDVYAFYNCPGFTGSLTIGNSVNSIRPMVFGGTNFEKIISLNPVAPTCELSIFSSYDMPLYVPDESIELYKTAEIWENFSYISGISYLDGPKSITITPSSIEISLGAKEQLSVEIDPATMASEVTWKSDNEEVATVSEDGTVTGVSLGTTTITATCGNISATCKVTVNPVEAEEIVLNIEAMTIIIGQTNKIKATVLPENTTDPTVIWKSDNEEVAIVSEDGTVTAESVGTATITATCGELSASCRVTVNPVVATKITLSAEELNIIVGQRNKITATVYPDNTTDKSVTWHSDNTVVATVSDDGTVTAVSVGTATITATCGNISESCKVTVYPVLSSGVVLNTGSMTITIGETGKLTATVFPENSTDKTVTWTSDNTQVATVSADGTVTAVSVGTATITATCGEGSASCKVTVNPVLATSITLNVEALTIVMGHTDRIIATVSPENTTDKTITWKSDNEKVATVSADGTVTAISTGLANITATCGDVYAICRVTVDPVLSDGIVLNYTELNIVVGQKEKLIARVYPEDTTDKTVTWKSDNMKVAIVSADGTVTALSVGTANITATSGGISATCKVNVGSQKPIGITLSPLSMTLRKGETGEYNVTFSPANAETSLVWSSADPSVAEVNDDGVVRGINPGMTIISALSDNGVVGMATVKVVDRKVLTVVITPDNLTLELDGTAQLTAQISPAIAESNITWSSLDTSVAVVNEDGLVTAVGKGATFIYATAENGVSGMAVVTVINSKEITSLIVEPGNLEMIVGREEQLEVIMTPSTTEAEITWLSSDPAVAEVSETGVVSALSPGLAIIYALSDNGMTGLATVKVVTNEVTSVIIEPDILTLELEETGQFRATIEPSVAETALIWSSNDPQVATIDEEGFVKATGAGFTVITATADNGVAGMAIVKVIDPNAEDSNPGMGYGDNGVYVSAIRIREGDMLGLFAERPIGYENNDWQYDWYLDGDLKAEGKNVMVAAGAASGWKGTTMEVSTEMYQVDITNLIGNEIILDLPEVKVYSRPLTPEELLRKGDGATRSFIAMSSLSDSELSRLGYSFVFGYNDADGVSHVISNSRLRYCHTTKEIYENPGNRFWVYTTWTFPDGATITSGLRYLDGSVNERFDKSDFNFSDEGDGEDMEEGSEVHVYTLEGHKVGKNIDNLAPGIYIIYERTGRQVTTRKIIKR